MAGDFHLVDFGLQFLPRPPDLNAQDAIVGHGGFDRQRIDIQGKDVGPGEFTGDESMSVDLLRMLGRHLQEVVHGADSDFIGGELADVKENLEFVFIEGDL